MKDSLYTVFYATVLGCVCAFLLWGAGEATAKKIAFNREAEEVFNILKVLGAPVDEDTPAERLLEIFEESVEVRGERKQYVYATDGTVDAVAIPVAGQGLWGPIKGFLSLEADMKTIRGVTFHEQEETPGLGGEIGAAWFTDQFKGKTIVLDGHVGIDIVRGGGELAANEVDDISGATMTCNAVKALLNAAIERFVEEQKADAR